MKRKLHVLLAIVMILSLSVFVGCGGDKATDSTDKNQTITDAPVATEELSQRVH